MHHSGISINRNFLNESFLNGTIASKSLRFYLHSAKRKKKITLEPKSLHLRRCGTSSRIVSTSSKEFFSRKNQDLKCLCKTCLQWGIGKNCNILLQN